MRIIKNIEMLEPVVLCASTDETRLRLNDLRNQDGFLFSTDGYRLFATKKLYRPNLEGKSIRKDVFATSFEMIEASDSSYPDVKSILPIGKKNIIGTFTVPLWLEKFKKLQKSSKTEIYLTFTDDGYLEVGRSVGDEYSITVDARLISPLYGMECKVGWKDAHSPMVLCDKDVENLYENDWFMVVMPIRAEKSPIFSVEHFEENKEELENVIPF